MAGLLAPVGSMGWPRRWGSVPDECEIACSEENPVPLEMGGKGYSVCFDPLDGSSIVDTNFSVGTIFGVWPGNQIVGTTGRDLAASGICVYGPRTTLCIAFKDSPGTHAQATGL